MNCPHCGKEIALCPHCSKDIVGVNGVEDLLEWLILWIAEFDRIKEPAIRDDLKTMKELIFQEQQQTLDGSEQIKLRSSNQVIQGPGEFHGQNSPIGALEGRGS